MRRGSRDVCSELDILYSVVSMRLAIISHCHSCLIYSGIYTLKRDNFF